MNRTFIWNAATILAAMIVSAGVARNYARPPDSPVPSGAGILCDATSVSVAVSSLGTRRRATAHEAVDLASWRVSLRTVQQQSGAQPWSEDQLDRNAVPDYFRLEVQQVRGALGVMPSHRADAWGKSKFGDRYQILVEAARSGVHPADLPSMTT